MARNKYIGDYRILEEFDEKGRVKTDYEYIGKPYYYEASHEERAKALKILDLLAVGGWIVYIAAMLPNSTLMRTGFVSLSFAFLAVPLFFLSKLAVSAHRWKEPLERRQAEEFAVRLPAASLGIMVLSLGALIGSFIILVMRGIRLGTVREGLLAADIFFSAMCLVMLWIGLMSFRRKDRFEAKAGE